MSHLCSDFLSSIAVYSAKIPPGDLSPVLNSRNSAGAVETTEATSFPPEISNILPSLKLVSLTNMVTNQSLIRNRIIKSVKKPLTADANFMDFEKGLGDTEVILQTR